MEVSWGHGCSPCFRGEAARNPSLHSNLGQPNLGNLGQDRQALESTCSPPGLSKRYLTAWEDARLEEQKLLRNPHFHQLSLEVASLKECTEHLVRLSLCKESSEHSLGHDGEQACNNKFEKRDGTAKDPTGACSLASCKTRGEHSRVDITQNKQQQQLAKQKQKPKEEEGGASQEEASEQDRPKQNTQQNSLGTNYIGSLGGEERETMTLHRILVDTGAETSVAPRSFADHVPFSFYPQDLELRGADGRSIHILGTREVELVTTGFSFTTSFVIADVEKPLLSLRSLLDNNLGLQLDSVKGHQLVNLRGRKFSFNNLDIRYFFLLVLWNLN